MSLEHTTTLEYRIFKSPVGDITLAADNTALRVLAWGEHLERLLGDLAALRRGDTNPILDRTCAQLTRYFAGDLREFDVPVAPPGTPFQRLVWAELGRIPYGSIISYQEQARRIGRPEAPRAVGAANGKNPISIVIPCHRVVSSAGHLTGYAGGLDAKRFLLELEDAALPRRGRASGRKGAQASRQGLMPAGAGCHPSR